MNLRGTLLPRVFGEGSHRIVYETWGEDNNEIPVILIHGLSGSGRWWKRNIDALSRNYPVYVIDLVGYGGNKKQKPVRIAIAAEAIAQFIASLQPGRANVVGHSMGGHVAITIAACFPERVERLVIATASGLMRSNVAAMAMRLPIAAHYSPLDFFPTLALDALRAGPLTLLRSTIELLHDDVSDMLSKVLAPTLLLWGSRDNLIPIASGKIMDAKIPNSRLEIIEGAGHVLMWDHAEIFNRLVLDFLSEPLDRCNSLL